MDFFCHRPFSCLEDIIRTELHDYKSPNLLVVSREPIMHAHLFRKKDRVVIQDFYLATPKHPFLKWLLDDRVEKYKKNQGEKGPFSYSIEKDIDRYRALEIMKLANSSSLSDLIDQSWFETAGSIYELPEGILH